MNMLANPVGKDAPDREDAVAALETLRRLLRDNPAEAAALGVPAFFAASGAGALNRDYPEDFKPDDAYRATLPDLQNGPASLIRAEGDDPACRHFQFPPAPRLGDARRGGTGAGNRCHRLCLARSHREGHQYEPDHAQLLCAR